MRTTTTASPDRSLAAAVFARIGAQSHRFLSVDDRGRLTARLDRLAVLVAEIVTEHTADLRSECDAAQDALYDMEREARTVIEELAARPRVVTVGELDAQWRAIELGER